MSGSGRSVIFGPEYFNIRPPPTFFIGWVKRLTHQSLSRMSAFGGKVDMPFCAAHVRFRPKADIGPDTHLSAVVYLLTRGPVAKC